MQISATADSIPGVTDVVLLKVILSLTSSYDPSYCFKVTLFKLLPKLKIKLRLKLEHTLS